MSFQVTIERVPDTLLGLTVGEVLNLLAIIIIPIVSVLVAQSRQNRAEKRKDKMQLFRTLVSSRIYGWTTDSVSALNIIEIVFSDNKKVCERWREYYNLLCVQNPTEEQQTEINTAHDELIKAMGKALGYKDKETLEILQHPYMPVGLKAEIIQQQTNRNDYFSAISLVKNMAERQMKSSMRIPEDTSSAQEEGNPNADA